MTSMSVKFGPKAPDRPSTTPHPPPQRGEGVGVASRLNKLGFSHYKPKDTCIYILSLFFKG